MSSRPLIALVLLAAVAGCDRGAPEATQATPTPTAAPAPAMRLDRSHKGQAAPSIAFLGPDGKRTTLAAFKGGPVLVNLWATWCAPCVKEMPQLDQLARRMTVVAISQDQEGAKLVGPFFAKARLSHLIAYLDPDSTFSLTMSAELPTSILYDAQGREVWRAAGGMDWTSPGAATLLAEAK